MALTQAQIQEYYATEGKKANPLSPTAWLAQKQGTSTKTTSTIPQSTLDNVSKQVALITQQVQNIAAQVPSASSLLFNAYGYNVYSNASVSLITAPDGSGRQAVKWTNPDGSYVWETVNGSNVQKYASQYYKQDTSSTTEPDYRSQMSKNQQTIYDTLQRQLDALTAKGQTINPYVEITPEKAAEFMAQAEREISPYYQTQMKLERENLLRSIGYDTESLNLFEQQMERTYGKNLNTLSENMAESGFAYSGKRKTEESDLAYNTQTQINENRRQSANQAANLASAYAQRWGSANLPASTTISATPNVVAGQSAFNKTGGNVNYYTLSPELYDDLIGSQQYEQTAQQKARASELEGAYKESELVNRQRQLTL